MPTWYKADEKYGLIENDAGRAQTMSKLDEDGLIINRAGLVKA